MIIQWVTPKKRSRTGYFRSSVRCRYRVRAEVSSRGFNAPLDEPCEIEESTTSICDAIAPSNEELRRSLSQFEPPPEWFDDSLEEQVW